MREAAAALGKLAAAAEAKGMKYLRLQQLSQELYTEAGWKQRYLERIGLEDQTQSNN